jgi:excisionase family DNA binding protein
METHWEPELLLTPREAADQLRCSTATIKRHLRNRTMGGVRVGNRWLIPEDELRALRTHRNHSHPVHHGVPRADRSAA